MANAQRQVLIEATVVEVILNDLYQAGIDWSVIHKGGAGFDVVQGSDLYQALVLQEEVISTPLEISIHLYSST
jgi:type II secretory pathway component GspD/PulD (secretin)